MAIVKKAKIEDFEKIYPLLLGLNNHRLSKEDWRRLFIKDWDNQEDYFGYMLVDRTQTVGFLGLIFSNRLINNKVQKFCNLTSAIVKKEYRSESILLFFPLLKLKEYTLTCFTPSKEVALILERLGFRALEDRIKIIFPIPGFVGNNCFVEFNRDVIKSCLGEKDLKVYYDHLNLKSIYLLLRSKDGNCYLVVNKTRKSKITFAQIHYISNLDIFLKCISMLRTEICLRLKVCGLLFDERYLKGRKITALTVAKRPKPRLFKSESLDRDDIDGLYSELVLLNL